MRLLSVEAITSFTELRKKSMASWKDRQGQLSVTIQHSCLWFYLLVHLHHVMFSRESMTENAAISNCIPSTTVLTGEKQAEPPSSSLNTKKPLGLPFGSVQQLRASCAISTVKWFAPFRAFLCSSRFFIKIMA